MTLRIATFSAALIFAALPVAAQQAGQPKPKSQKEVDALKKVQADAQANNYDQEIQDINYTLENFADTEFKNMLLNMAMEASEKKGDYANTIAYGEKVIQADPNDTTARVTLAQTMAAHAHDTDLDKDQSVKKIEEYANKALELLKASSAPPQGIDPAQWPAFQKQLEGEAHDALATAALLQKNYPKSIEEYKAALAAFPNPAISAHLGKAYLGAKQWDDAIANADKVLAAPDASAAVKQVAQQQKDVATKMKGSK
jgi:tetratricopeptide (TPR) repeat protein